MATHKYGLICTFEGCARYRAARRKRGRALNQSSLALKHEGLADADAVEAALARLPRLAGTPALGEIVNALMELVKRAHEPASARNIHLS